MEKRINRRIRIKVMLILQMIDDFTSKPIETHLVQIRAEHISAPIKKNDGYFVFADCGVDFVHMTISAACYLTQKLIIRMDELNKKEPVVRIRLKPDSQYPLQPGIVLFNGNAANVAKVAVVLWQSNEYWKLLYDYPDDTDKLRLYLYNPSQQKLEGMSFWIMDKERRQQEIFTIVSQVRAEGISYYRLAAPLGCSYKKPGSRIYPVYSTETDQSGDYFLPVKGEVSEAVSCLWFLDDKQLIKNIPIENRNRINFDMR